MRSQWVILAGMLLAAVTAAYLVFGGTILAIVLISLSVILYTIAVFGAGAWYAHNSISLGVNLALKSQEHNDKWDANKTKSLSDFGKAVAGLSRNGGVTIGDQMGYPALPSDDEIVSGFLTSGFEDNEFGGE